MLLAIDVGNSETVIGLFEGTSLLHQWRVTSLPSQTGDELGVLFHSLLGTLGRKEEEISGLAVSSVVPGLTPAYEQMGERLLGRPPLVISHRTAGLPVLYPDAGSVGADRLVNAVAVIEDYGAPAIVVDLGTATTFDVVNGKGEYVGGVIAPGVVASANALFQRGARLARVEIRRPERVVGRTTEESIQSGIFYGTVGSVDTLVRSIIREEGFDPGLPVIATGGLAGIVAGSSETITAADDSLTVRGIRLVWERNRRGSSGAR